MTQNLNHYEKILSRSHSNYLAQISIEMTDANNQINDVLSKLTALGTVLIPMNLVTGVPLSFLLSLPFGLILLQVCGV
jgi:magnesium transporter